MLIVTQNLKSTLLLLFSFCLSFYLYAQPTISSFSPSTGPIGTIVVINGTNFSPVATNNIVYFGAVKASINSATSNSLTVVVPNGATYEPITVTTNGLTGYSAKPFIVTFPGGGTITPNSFQDKTDLSAGESPYDIASADFDGDGKPDMAVVNGGYPYSISIYKNTSSGGITSFANKIDVPTGNVPFSIAISDIDGDGKTDIIITNEFPFAISVFRNISTPGNISFDVRVDVPALNPSVVATGDLNKDGKPDLVVTNDVANSISIYKNTSTPGNISFATRTDYPTGQFPTNVSIGDIDGDSWQDVVVASEQYISILKNDATPGISFTIHNNLLTGVGASTVILTDLDGDNKLDLGVDKGSNSISIYRNISSAGSISFSPGLDFFTADGPMSFAIGDLDGDGKPDLAVSCGSDSISVLRNTGSSGSISFQPKVNFLTGIAPYDLTIADFDGDSKPDLATANQGGNAVSLLRNQIDGPDITSFNPTSATAGATVTITGARFTEITQVYFGDVPAQSFTVVSASTIQAVIGMGASGEVRVTGSKGAAKANGFNFLVPTGQFPPPVITSFTPAAGPIGTTVTITGKNFDGFAANNIVYFGATRAKVLSASATSLSVQVPIGTTHAPITVTTNQLTASSAIPFVSTFQTGPAFTYNSFGSPEFVERNAGSHIADADIDGDGKIDIVYGWLIAARNISTVNSISFTPHQEVIPGMAGGLFEFGDIDNDGKPDLVRVTTDYDATFSVLKNQSSVGAISFTKAATYSIPDHSSAFAIKDLDIDGKPDIIVSVRGKDLMAIYRNNSYGSVIQFDPQTEVATGDDPVHISSSDLDGDGKPEVILTNNAGNSISIFPNNSVPGSLSFGANQTYKVLGGPVETTLADFDGDGKLDIAVVTYGGNQVLVFKNTSTAGSISFSLATTFSTYVFPIRIRAADMNGDGKPDVAAFSEEMNSISVFKNMSNPTTISFGEHVWYTTEYVYGDMEIADFNGDGKNDIVVGVDRTGIGIVKNNVGTARTDPSGSNPVKGEIRNRMMVDQTVKTYNGSPFVQRHYDIEPVDNPSTSTATITLYFTQEDFDNFNAFSGQDANLPANPNDNSGKANLRVYQYHGISATSLPGSYNGLGIEINPDDANIFWNARASCWEVTFNVTGFSGFFVSNTSFNSILPPVITAGSSTSFCQGGNVVLTSSASTGNQWYKDGLIITGASLPTFQATASGVYSTTITVNGNTSLASNSIVITATTVPAQPVISSDGTTLTSSSASGNQWYREGVAITGAVNQTYKPLDAANYSVTVTNNGCTSVFSTGYYFVPAPIITTAYGTIICQGQSVVLTSSAVTNNQWYKDGIVIAGAIDRTYQASQSGNYTATTSVNNITSGPSNKITITASAGPAKPTITVNGANLESSAATGNQWYKDGSIIQGATNKIYKPLTNGNYSVITTDASTNCSAESDRIYFAVTGIINIDNTHFIKLSPNPVINEVLLNYRLAGVITVNLQIMDIQGHVYENYNNLSDGSKMNLSGFAKGVYLAKITDSRSKKSYIIKLIKL